VKLKEGRSWKEALAEN